MSIEADFRPYGQAHDGNTYAVGSVATAADSTYDVQAGQSATVYIRTVDANTGNQVQIGSRTWQGFAAGIGANLVVNRPGSIYVQFSQDGVHWEDDSNGRTIYAIVQETAPSCTIVSPVDGSTPGTLTPTFQLQFSDPDSGFPGQFDSYQLQVYRVSDGHLMWDTKKTAATTAQQSARAVSLTYAGSALTQNVEYYAQAQVWDGAGTSSGYTSPVHFTPKLVPSPPTITSPVAGKINTLTPLVQGSYNQGGGQAEAGFQYQLYQGATLLYDTGTSGTTPIATGETYGGAPALAWATAYRLLVASIDSNGGKSDFVEVDFTTDAAPLAPTNIYPQDGSVIGQAEPTFSWQHNDPDGDAQTGVKVSLYDLTAGSYVSGYQDAEFAQAAESLTDATALTLNHQYQLMLATKGADPGAGFGPYSSPVTFTYANAPTIALTSPTDGGTVGTPSIPVAWTFSDGPNTQQSYEVVLYAADNVSVLYDSGTVAGTATSALVPSGYVHNNEQHSLQLTVTDSLGQTAMTGKVGFTVSYALPPTITGIMATTLGSQP